MSRPAVLGLDVGTSSTKGVLVAIDDGTLLGTSVREHSPNRPGPGMVEMDASLWWDELASITRELLGAPGAEPIALSVSGMGPCVVLADEHGAPLRPAILYGVDTRSVAQIERLERELGADEILSRCGSRLSSQAAGAKVAWVADEEPDVFSHARRLFMPSSWLVHRLTGEYVLDHHSASQCTPLYDTLEERWYEPWARLIAPQLELPQLRWSDETAGTVTIEAAAQTGLPAGIPVTVGTIDAWAEAISVDAHHLGDLMLMYGTTMFLIHTVAGQLRHSSLWSTVGAFKGSRNLAGGMATSGAITSWLRDLTGSPSFEELISDADTSGVGANGLLMLPYFAGERTPIMDPMARGVIAGLTLEHRRGDLFRAALEATGFGVRHNIETIERAGGKIERVVAVGGGTQGGLWTQLVSDITGCTQELRSISVGAAYGDALLAARAAGVDPSIDKWNPVLDNITPEASTREAYDELYALYLDLYDGTADIVHALAGRQLQ
jgi:xylulokinase